MTSSLAEALAAFQAELPPVKKTKTAEVKNADNKKLYDYKYADLADVSEQVLPLLGKHGLSFTSQPTLRDDGQFGLAYQLLHSSGELIDGWYPLDARLKVQQIGGHITYARRYCLCAITGVAAEEDTDGQGLNQADARKPRESPPRRPKDELPRNEDGTISRSRTTDEEKDAAGIMTDEQQKAFNALRRDVLDVDSKDKARHPQGQHLDAAPPDDPWYDPPPPAAVRQPRAAQDPAQQIAMHFQRLGITDRDVRLGYTARLAGLARLDSTKDLTAREGLAVLGKLARCKDGDALLAVLEEVPVA